MEQARGEKYDDQATQSPGLPIHNKARPNGKAQSRGVDRSEKLALKNARRAEMKVERMFLTSTSILRSR